MEKLLPVSGLLKKSFAIYQQRFGVLAGIQLLNVPFALIGGLYGKLFFRDSFRDAVMANPWAFGAMAAVLLAVFIAGVIVTLWTQLALILSMKERQPTMDAGGLLALAWQKSGSFAWVYFLTNSIVVGGFLMLVVPGILFAVWFSFALYVFAAEGLTGMEALKRSRALVAGNWWGVGYRFLCVGALFFMMLAVTSWIPFASDALNIFFCMPFGVIFGYLLYDNVKNAR